MKNTTLYENELDVDAVEEGDLMMFTYWGKVSDVEDQLMIGKSLTVENVYDDDKEFRVSGNVLIERAKSADRFETTTRMSRTDLINKFVEQATALPMTVHWIKKDGTRRTLRGRILSTDDRNQGYIYMEDLDLPVGNRIRQVDTRTLKWFIADNVKYVSNK